MPSQLLSALSQASPARLILGSVAALLLLSMLFRLCRYARRRRAYKASEYAKNTRKPMGKALSDAGSRGEYELYLETNRYLEDKGRWLFNVYIPRPNGTTTEIDAILFHPSGIYVIESKNYRGQIIGSDRREQWLQCLKTSRRGPVQTYAFYNPLKQNRVHVDALRARLGQAYAHIPLYSVILFGNHCSLKRVRLTEEDCILDHRRNFPFIVNRIAARTSFSDTERVMEAYESVSPLSGADRATKARHKNEVRTAHRRSPYKEVTLYAETPPSPCPLCGGTLITRIAKKGPRAESRFLGCSNFPTCRYTQNINEDP